MTQGKLEKDVSTTGSALAKSSTQKIRTSNIKNYISLVIEVLKYIGVDLTFAAGFVNSWRNILQNAWGGAKAGTWIGSVFGFVGGPVGAILGVLGATISSAIAVHQKKKNNSDDTVQNKPVEEDIADEGLSISDD